jgi:hypothetical protein
MPYVQSPCRIGHGKPAAAANSGSSAAGCGHHPTDRAGPAAAGSVAALRYRARAPAVRPTLTATLVAEPTLSAGEDRQGTHRTEALAQARDDINEAREAFIRADGHRRGQCARSVIDSTATMPLDPAATPREVVAAHSFLREALALDDRPTTCGAESIDTVGEASTLPPEDQKWLQNYLAASRRPITQ